MPQMLHLWQMISRPLPLVRKYKLFHPNHDASTNVVDERKGGETKLLKQITFSVVLSSTDGADNNKSFEQKAINNRPNSTPLVKRHSSRTTPSGHSLTKSDQKQPGSIAFGECEISALSDLFLQFARTKDSVNNGDTPYLNSKRIKLLLESVGEKPDELTLQSLMEESNMHKDGRLRLDCFLQAADRILGQAPARIVLIVGGPGSGKVALCERLAQECGAVHLSCGEMLREEVEPRQAPFLT